MEEIFKESYHSNKYLVSNYGYIVRNYDTYSRVVRGKLVVSKHTKKRLGGKILSPKRYPRINLNGDYFLIHQVVARTFIPNPNNYQQVNHIDGNKLNNRVDNLEWVSNQQNRDHAVKNRLIAYGEKIGMSKLTLEQVKEIQTLANSGEYTQKQIANKFNICQQTVSKIKLNKTWQISLKG